MSESYTIADWSQLQAEPDLHVPLPSGGALLMRRIPFGSFFMGARGSGFHEEPRHCVVLQKDFYLGKFVVTQAEWRAVAALSPMLSKSPGVAPSGERNKGDSRPVTDVSWDDATAWCDALGAALCEEVKKRLTTCIGGAWQFRLPTEAEWEYACRAGSDTDYLNGDGEAALAELAWFGEEWGTGAAHDVGQKPPNAAGLFDMHGNVWEWCRDVFYWNTYRRREDGVVAPEENLRVEDKHESQLRVMRGGSWGYSAGGCRSAYRGGGHPGGRSGVRGFRLCLAPGPAAASTAETELERRSPDRETEGEGRARSRTGGAEPGRELDLSSFTFPAKPGENNLRRFRTQ